MCHRKGRVLTFLRENELINHDVVRINLVLCELLNQSLGFVERQEFGDADADKGGLVLSSRGCVSDSGENRQDRERTGSLNWVLTSVMIALIESSLANMSS